MSKRIYDGIIFDLDGTLWDAVEVIHRSWKKVVSSHSKFKNFITLEELQSFMGSKIDDIFKSIYKDIDDKDLYKIIDECTQEECSLIRKEGGKLYPNLIETLDALYKKYPLFIVSNCQSGYIEAFLEYHDLHKYFKDYECSGNTGLEKGENIRLVMKRNGIKNPIYVGDAKVDLEATKKVGIDFVYASYGFGSVDSFKIKIDSLKELLLYF
ncbi:HAD family hydrolase [Caloramator sp. E03]|uniref:HAD family hydrolase n=1 Tax=Caloramator sp. E03 TaxID=2576307 RepID=UPI001110E8F6|nr:HAD family hydrolase [Caloramator sp. E03]QCX34731.1 HAD family hydrolase [Caloramator sp. E03]